jgi:hypothetical protein
MTNLCQTCLNRRWIPLSWKYLPEEITAGTFDYYVAHERRAFYDPCPACNSNVWWKFDVKEP